MRGGSFVFKISTHLYICKVCSGIEFLQQVSARIFPCWSKFDNNDDFEDRRTGFMLDFCTIGVMCCIGIIGVLIAALFLPFRMYTAALWIAVGFGVVVGGMVCLHGGIMGLKLCALFSREDYDPDNEELTHDDRKQDFEMGSGNYNEWNSPQGMYIPQEQGYLGQNQPEYLQQQYPQQQYPPQQNYPQQNYVQPQTNWQQGSSYAVPPIPRGANDTSYHRLI